MSNKEYRMSKEVGAGEKGEGRNVQCPTGNVQCPSEGFLQPRRVAIVLRDLGIWRMVGGLATDVVSETGVLVDAPNTWRFL